MFTKVVAAIVLSVAGVLGSAGSVSDGRGSVDLREEETQDVRDFAFVEYGDITDPLGDYLNLQISVGRCFDINETEEQINECVNYLTIGAYTRTNA